MPINLKIEPSWRVELLSEFEKPYFKQLKDFLIEEKRKFTIYPKGSEVFSAFENSSFKDLKVVILGQDPYHGVGQAHGLAFSVQYGVKPPPSLVNIFKELQSDLGIAISPHGDLTKWAKQGVFLLNTSLTVRANEANSHRGQGWERFTDAVIRHISEQKRGVVFILWGASAGAKAALIDKKRHLIVRSSHPSPLSAYRGFFGSRPFSKTNEYLKLTQQAEIDWSLVDTL